MGSVKAKRTTHVTEKDLANALAKSWTRATSYDPAHWSRENSAWGQCAVSALVVQDLLGGHLLSGRINGIEHYWNRLADNTEIDLTRTQFKDVESIDGIRYADREYVLSFPQTRRRYYRLLQNVMNHLQDSDARADRRTEPQPEPVTQVS
jgi:hypothetical protein